MVPEWLWLCHGSKRLRRQSQSFKEQHRNDLSAFTIPMVSACRLKKIRPGRIGAGSLVAAREISKLTKVLDVLEAFAERNHYLFWAVAPSAVRKVHGHSNADQYLTGAATGGHGPYKNSISVDQVYRRAHAGEFTRHSSLVMSTNGGIGGPRGAQTQSFNREGRADSSDE